MTWENKPCVKKNHMNDHAWLRTLGFLRPLDARSFACTHRRAKNMVSGPGFRREYWPQHPIIRTDTPLIVCCELCGALEGAMAMPGPTCFDCVRAHWTATARVPGAVWTRDGWYVTPPT